MKTRLLLTQQRFNSRQDPPCESGDETICPYIQPAPGHMDIPYRFKAKTWAIF